MGRRLGHRKGEITGAGSRRPIVLAALLVLAVAGCGSAVAGRPSAIEGADTAVSGESAPGQPGPGADAPTTGTPTGTTPTIGAPGSDPRTDPTSADPTSADPTSADPTGADPTGADPTGAHPTSGSQTDGGGDGTVDISLAELRTVEPCSFLSDSAFRDLGDEQHIERTSHDYTSCSLQLSADGAKGTRYWTIDISLRWQYHTVDALAAAHPGTYTTDRRGGIDVFTGTSDDGACVRAIALPDPLPTAVIMVGGKKDVCVPADPALASAVEAVTGHRLAPADWPQHSLARVDLCTKFRHVVETAIGPSRADPSGLHTCIFDHGQSSVMVSFGASNWPPLGFDDSAGTMTLSGHPVLVNRNVADGRYLYFCGVSLGDSGVGLGGAVDVLNVWMSGPGNGKKQAPALRRLLAAGARAQ